MKKEVVLTVRVDSETDDIIRSLAKKDDRTIAWTTRKLITEALMARKLLKPKSKK
jgi:predicted transcriptional regulator